MAAMLTTKNIKRLGRTGDIPLYIFLVIVLAIVWSGVKTLQNNYELQKRVSTLQQQNQVLNLQNQNTALQNEYFKTDDYLDIAARQNLGLAAPGEKVLLISKSVALKYVDQSSIKKSQTPLADNRPKYIKNIEAWRDFLLGRKASG